MDLPLGQYILLERSQLSYCHAMTEAGVRCIAVITLNEELSAGKEARIRCKMLIDEAKQVTGGKAIICVALPAGGFIYEPYGELPFAAGVAHFHELAAICADLGADAVMVHRAKSMLQARAGVLGARASELPVLVSMEPIGEGESLLCGTDILSAYAVLGQLGIAAFGYASNVTGLQLEALSIICKHRCTPIFSISSNLTGALSAADTGELFARRAASLAKRGVSAVGIWGAGEAQLVCAAQALTEATQCTESCGDLAPEELWAANETQVYYLDENIEFSEPVACRPDMTDDILDAEKEVCDVLCIEMNSQDEAYAISQNNGHMDQMPVAFLSHDEAALETALFYYNGRAVIDSRSTLDPEVLSRLAKQYAAVII
ncbi:MAG: hypothetical protein RRY54_03685 [Angelakisella sp.]